jgi:hypothetical protein
MHDLPVEVSAPRSVDDIDKKQTGNHEKVRHAERQRKGDDGMQPAFAANGLLYAERRMHHHHKDDAETFGVIDPVDPAVMELRRIHAAVYGATGFQLA